MTLFSAEASPTNAASRAARAIRVGLAVVRLAPPWPRPHRFRSARIHEAVAIRFTRSQVRASREDIEFAFLYEVKEGFTRQLLLNSLCLTDLRPR